MIIMMRCDLEMTRVEVIGWRKRPVSFCIGRRVLNLFFASGWELCSTEVELVVLIFALQCGKVWNRSFVSREFL